MSVTYSQDELLSYEEIRERWPRVSSRRRLEVLSKQGYFPKFIRLNPRGPALWPLESILLWFDKKKSAAA